MPNHQVPIEDADLWDILDYDATVNLSLGAVGDPRDRGADTRAWMARTLIDDPNHEDAFHRICRVYVIGMTATARRNRIGDLARMFGADTKRLTDYVAFKWALVKRRDPAKPQQT